MDRLKPDSNWQQTDSQKFWINIAANDHVVQIYEKENDFLDLVENFVLGGIKADDSIIVIATAAHLQSLKNRMEAHGIDIDLLIASRQFFPLDAGNMLEKFMVDGWPDEYLFTGLFSNIVKKARVRNRKVRAFGEMVSLLWEKGYEEATVNLENLWNSLLDKEDFCLFCAYPKSGLSESSSASVIDICCSHSKMVTGKSKSKTEMFYKNIH